MALAPGEMLGGRYRIVRWLAEGGFGAVYLAEDTQHDNRLVAIKESLERSPRAEAQFTREASLLARLDHPHLPHVIDYFSLSEHGQYLVMDYIAGQDLRAWLAEARAPLPEAQVLAWMRQVCAAVQYLHGQQPPIIHRDIKPANIKITPDGRAILVDFGIAKLFDIDQVTATSARAISPGYSPVEQYGGGTDERSDIYALGATLYHLLTAQVPTESVRRSSTQPLPSPQISRSDISAHVAQAILKATAYSAEGRYDSVAGLVAALSGPGATARPPRPADLPTVRARLPGQGRRWHTSELLRRPRTWLWSGAATGLLLSAFWLTWRFVLPSAGATPSPQPLALSVVVSPTEPLPSPTAPVPPTATQRPTPTSTHTPSATATATPFGGQRGRWLAFVSMRDGHRQLYLMQPDGSSLTQLVNSAANDNSPAWAPTGARLAFASDRDGNWEIYAVNADGAGLANLTNSSANDETPAWSPDGQWLAFTSNRDGDYDLYLMRPDGSDLRPLTTAADDDNFPAWSPDGQWLAFQSHRDGYWTLYAIRADGTQETRLVSPAFGGFTPAWSPDGSHLAFMSFRDGPSKLFQLDFAQALQGQAVAEKLSTNSVDDQSPVWSPDGQQIVFTSKRTGDYEIYVLTLADQSMQRLTQSGGHDQYPAWQP
jgi:Tol biopolymer transport system component